MECNNKLFVGKIKCDNPMDSISIVCMPENPVSGEIIRISYQKYVETIQDGDKSIIITNHYSYNLLGDNTSAFSCLVEKNGSSVGLVESPDECFFEFLYNFIESDSFDFIDAKYKTFQDMTSRDINNKSANEIVKPIFSEIANNRKSFSELRGNKHI